MTIPIIPLRASSLPDLFDCPARWKAKNLDRLFTPMAATGFVGTCMHEALADFDRATMARRPISTAETQERYRQLIWSRHCSVAWKTGERESMDAIGRTLISKYIEKEAPKYQYLAVEYKCQNVEVEVGGVLLRLSGTLDRIYTSLESMSGGRDGDYGILDYKTGKQAVSPQFTVEVDAHRPQVGMYELLGIGVMGKPPKLPGKIVGLQTIKEARVASGDCEGGLDLLVGSRDVPGLLVDAARILKQGLFYGNAKSSMCDAKYCPVFASCRFRMAKAA